MLLIARRQRKYYGNMWSGGIIRKLCQMLPRQPQRPSSNVVLLQKCTLLWQFNASHAGCRRANAAVYRIPVVEARIVQFESGLGLPY